MKHITHLLVLFSCCLLLLNQALAQLEIRLSTDRKEFLIGENVPITFTIINHTDRTLDFKNVPGNPWLRFRVTCSASPFPISPKALAKFPRLTIGPGQQQSYKLDLKASYDFNLDGSYRVVAIVQMPGGKEAFASSPARFTMGSGSTLKTFNIQSKGRPLQIHVKQLQADGRNCLFGQVAGYNSRTPIGACYLGKFLHFMEPRIYLDSAQNLHVLCQSSPEIFTYSIMNNQGKRVSLQLLQRSGGPVDLMRSGSKIVPVGLRPYVKPTPQQEDVHNASDVPF